METTALAPAEAYWHYIHQCCPTHDCTLITPLFAVDTTSWDEPESALELNNFAVLALIEAEQCESRDLREMSLNLAIEALTRAVELQPTHPICVVHLALTHAMLGDQQTASHIAYELMLQLAQLAYNPPDTLPLGLVYLPMQGQANYQASEHLPLLLQAEQGYLQALWLAVIVLQNAQLMFGNQGGVHFLQLSIHLMPHSIAANLRLGLANLMSMKAEGLLYLQRANQLMPGQSAIVQALYLGYRDMQQWETAAYWVQMAQIYAQQQPDDRAWAWTKLPIDNSFTYFASVDQVLMAIEPSISSIVTGILLGQGDWFEAEMEFWRSQLQPGMTVIDVGANVGVYTFSAARRVGASGKVVAVEPFSGCVNCLRETVQANQLDWVTICAGAASDRQGQAHLSLSHASELNELVTEDALLEAGAFETVTCFLLDDLITQENLDRVDWLKIDAEGHEMQVLAGSERILQEFKPIILYENINARTSNTDVADYLRSKGYHLFRYQPFVQTLIPVEAMEELEGNLNIVAIHNTKTNALA